MKKFYALLGLISVVATVALVVFLNKTPSALNGRDLESVHGEQATQIDNLSSGNSSARVVDQNVNGGFAHESKEYAVKSERVNTFLKTSMMADELRFMDEQMRAQEVHMQQGGFEDIAALDEIRAKLDGAKLMEDYAKALSDEFSDIELDRLNEIYSNPYVQKIKQQEAHNRTPEGMQEMMKHAESFDPSTLSSEKLKSIKEYVKASGADENWEKVSASIEGMMGDAGPKKTSKEMRQFQNEMKKLIEDAQIAVAAKTFHDASPDQVMDTATILKDPVVQREINLKANFWVKAMEDALGNKLRDAMLSASNADKMK